MTFEELGLGQELCQAVAEAGYTDPTPIQARAIPYVLQGRDILGCAQTGTGKTASFALPMLDILSTGRTRARMPRALILEPTRELAQQVSANFIRYGANHAIVHILIVGGEAMGEQEKAFGRGADIVVATPGRLLDLFERGYVLLSDLRILVIDEVDQMLDIGFIPDIERIVSLLPQRRQTLFFSATMAPEIRKLAGRFLTDAKEISVAPPASPAELVTQNLVRLAQPNDKVPALLQLLKKEDVQSILLFCNQKSDIQPLVRTLAKNGYSVKGLHGDMAQPVRTATMNAFKAGDVAILVSSDVAARGIDIPDCSHVFNVDVPFHAENYVHRIGRTGRAGREGIAYTLATPDDANNIQMIENLIKQSIPIYDQIDGVASEQQWQDGIANRSTSRGGRTASGGRSRASSSSRRESGKTSTRRATGSSSTARRKPAKDIDPASVTETSADTSPSAPSASPPPAKRRVSRTPAKAAPTTPPSALQPKRGNDESGFSDHMPAFLLRPVAITKKE